jgi:hypothetical protein
MHDGAKVIVAICAVAAVEIVALLTGHNGTLLRFAIIAIAGLGGFSLAQLLKRKP